MDANFCAVVVDTTLMRSSEGGIVTASSIGAVTSNAGSVKNEWKSSDVNETAVQQSTLPGLICSADKKWLLILIQYFLI